MVGGSPRCDLRIGPPGNVLAAALAEPTARARLTPMHQLRRLTPKLTPKLTPTWRPLQTTAPTSAEMHVTVSRAEHLYERSKRAVVWLVKQLDSHLCDLDRRIEERIASRAKARAEGNFEQIATEQNRLGELCIEHKARLDSMLFMWVLAGLASVAGWTRAALRSAPPAASLSSSTVDHAILATAVQTELSRRESLIASEVEAGVRAALKASAMSAGRSEGAGVGIASLLGDEWARRTFCAALGACALSGASLVVAISSRRK